MIMQSSGQLRSIGISVSYSPIPTPNQKHVKSTGTPNGVVDCPIRGIRSGVRKQHLTPWLENFASKIGIEAFEGRCFCAALALAVVRKPDNQPTDRLARKRRIE